MALILAAPQTDAGQIQPARLTPRNRKHNAQTIDPVSVQNRPLAKIKAKFWTPEKLELLRTQWALNTAVSAIAKELGTTRGAITGKARRLHLPMHEGSMAHPDRRDPEKKRPRTRYGTPRNTTFKIVNRPPPVNLPEAFNIAFSDLEPRHCRYAVTPDYPFLFCGATKDGDSSYCAFHHTLCHEKPKERKQTVYIPPRRAA